MKYLNGLMPFLDNVQALIFWYPYIMSIVWITGSLIFVHYREKDEQVSFHGYKWPKISILLPCYNEADTVEETVKNLSKLSYPDYEIIAVNDGSSDNTGEILEKLAKRYKDLRVINCLENRGKANALHIAAHASKSEYLICVDSDAILDDKAPFYMVKQFLEHGERVGAVTGNPRIRNRDTLLGKIQLIEYASIIGLIKRTQRILGKVMTVSGVIVAFRKKALMSVDLWDRDIITEDIGVSWKLQRKFWDIRYEPRALCWMLVPETLSGLWKQRVRWAQGGQEIIFRHGGIFKSWKQRRLWPVYIEQVCSTLWAVCWIVYTFISIFTAQGRQDLFVFFTFSAFALSILSFIQLFISIKHESTYDNIMKHFIWVVWYPAVYWMLNAFVAVAALPKSIKSTMNRGYATWKSPDRGDIGISEIDATYEEDKSFEEETSGNEYIVKSNQRYLKKIIASLINTVMWFYMFLAIYMFFSACFNHNDIFIGTLKASLKLSNSDIRAFVFLTLKCFAISFIVLYSWRLYNFKKFGKLHRRKFPKETTRDEMLSLNLIKEEVYDILQGSKVIRFEKNPVRELDGVK